ncbi:hypothetical protein [Paramuribaculum intestinale]|uniref:hypothetical protein n=1 Tax=Paramuribaculum intestinale TaxID=2094151 RepID=UPI0025A95CC9|nr:hypothetical protein [Paramuribaculum intestinale]
MKRTIMSLVACVALCFAASAQKQWHQDLINTASASPSADVNAVVNRNNMTGRIKNARYRIYLQPASAENVRRRLITHQKEAGMYSLDSKKLVMSFDDAGVRTNYSLSLKGRKRLLLISQQPSSSAVADDSQSVSVYSSDISVSSEKHNEMLRQAAEARRQGEEARRQAAEARKQAAEARRQAAEARKKAGELRRQWTAKKGVSVKRSNNAVTLIQNDPTPSQKQELNSLEESLRKESERRRRELQ